MKNLLKKLSIGACSAAAVVLPLAVSASAADTQNLVGLNYGTVFGLGSKDVRETIGGIVRAFMGLLGVVAVILILFGGFKWMTSQGNEEKVAEAKKIIISGVIGLIIILSAYAIATFVISNIAASV